MAITIKNLAQGDISASPTSVLASTDLKSMIVKNVVITNSEAAQQTFTILVTKTDGSGVDVASCHLSPVGTQVPAGGRVVLDLTVYLSYDGVHTNRIKLSGGTLKYLINGMERDN